ncbi:MAG: hypothetical protein GY940_28470, partial [bacterium]|nr:hypothetical protein [bacterium]
ADEPAAETAPAPTAGGEGEKDEPGPQSFRSTHFDLMLHASDEGDSVRLNFEYSTALFKRETIEELATYYLDILEQVVTTHDIPLADITVTHGLKTSETAITEDDEDWL